MLPKWILLDRENIFTLKDKITFLLIVNKEGAALNLLVDKVSWDDKSWSWSVESRLQNVDYKFRFSDMEKMGEKIYAYQMVENSVDFIK